MAVELAVSAVAKFLISQTPMRYRPSPVASHAGASPCGSSSVSAGVSTGQRRARPGAGCSGLAKVNTWRRTNWIVPSHLFARSSPTSYTLVVLNIVLKPSRAYLKLYTESYIYEIVCGIPRYRREISFKMAGLLKKPFKLALIQLASGTRMEALLSLP